MKKVSGCVGVRFVVGIIVGSNFFFYYAIRWRHPGICLTHWAWNWAALSSQICSALGVWLNLNRDCKEQDHHLFRRAANLDLKFLCIRSIEGGWADRLVILAVHWVWYWVSDGIKLTGKNNKKKKYWKTKYLQGAIPTQFNSGDLDWALVNLISWHLNAAGLEKQAGHFLASRRLKLLNLESLEEGSHVSAQNSSYGWVCGPRCSCPPPWLPPICS
jgi:hypothetical protein